MAPQNKSKKGKKVHPARDGKRSLVSPAAGAHPAPTTPIPQLTVWASQPALKTVSLPNGKVQTVKKLCFENSTPVYYAPDEPWPSSSLNRGAIVELTGQERKDSVEGLETSWSEVAYETQGGAQWETGWVNDAYLDDYREEFPNSEVVIPNQTPDPRDAQQYMIWEDKVKYNMCGELCVAFIVNDDIDSVLAKWKKNSPDSYNAILAAGRDNPTWERDLKSLLGAILTEYGYGSEADQVISLSAVIPSPVNPVNLLEHFKAMLPTHYLISRIVIDGSSGELVRKSPNGTGHWIVVDKVTRNGTRLEVYNPFPNKREEYSFSEYYNSFSTTSGIWVKRKEACPASPIEDLPKLEVQIDNPNPTYAAAQFIDVDGRKKTNLCGEFCVAFVLKQPIRAVLDHWKQVQPILYETIVGGNNVTGSFILGNILRAHDYNTEGDFTEFRSGLTDLFLKKCLISPGRIAKMLETHFLIAGVNIDRTGLLKPGDDIAHWIVVNKFTPIGRQRGWVEIYNPYQNHREEYSYREFMDSAGMWSGMWVKRSVDPVHTDQVVVSWYADDKPQKGDRIKRWTQYQLDMAIKEQLAKGKPPKKIAASLAANSGWKARDISRKLELLRKTGQAGAWSVTQLREELQRRLGGGKPVKNISAKVAKLSGWKKQDVDSALKELVASQKWAELRLRDALREGLNAGKPRKKVVADLVDRSGWTRRGILGELKKLEDAQRWTDGRLRDELGKYLHTQESLNKIAAELTEKSGWKKQAIRELANKMREAAKWTEPNLVEAIIEELKAGKPARKIADELAPKSGWKKREIISRLKRLREAVKWTEEQVRKEVAKLLETGKSVSKIAAELSEISGWKNWEVSKILKEARKIERGTDRRVHRTLDDEFIKEVNPTTIVHASLPRVEFREWQDSLLAQPGSKLRRVLKWGEKPMLKYGFDVNQAGCTNFQAVGLYNDGNHEFGAVSNYIRLPHEDVMRLRAMQIEDDYVAKRAKDWRKQKMKWLCKARGTIYFYFHHASSGDWKTLSYIEWGTLALGGNLVQVEETQVVFAKMRDGVERDVEVARLKGFEPSDWDRSLDELLAEGLVHRCFCAYKSNHWGDSPKGIVYSPFYSPQCWEFVGKTNPTALYIPTEWLEPKKS